LIKKQKNDGGSRRYDCDGKPHSDQQLEISDSNDFPLIADKQQSPVLGPLFGFG
jgi:hypothetical protein